MFHCKSIKYKNLSDGNWRLSYYAGQSQIEVIGNIYDNPELIGSGD